MPEQLKVLAACVPCSLRPNWPKQTGDSYELVDCPDCGEPMWLGLKQKAVVEAGEAQMTCMLCAIQKYKTNEDTPVSTLSEDGNGVIVKINAKEGGGQPMSDTAVDKKTADEVMELLQSLLPTKELLEQATQSFNGENYDESDEKLVNAAKRVIDLERGLGPEPGISWDWVEACFGVAVANALGFAKHIQGLIKQAEEGDDPAQKAKMAKLIKHLTEAAFAQAPDPVKKKLKEIATALGDQTSILFLWALYNGGVRDGLVAGWRCHEVAIVGAITPKE